MRNHLLKVIALMVCLFIGVLNTSVSFAQQPVVYSEGVAQGIIRVKFTEPTDARLQVTPMNGGIATLGIATFDATAHQYAAKNMRRVFPYNAKFEHKLRKHGLHLWYQMEVTSGVSAEAVVSSFTQLPDVELAEVIREKRLIEPDAKFEPISKDQIQALSETAPVNDPLLSKQWHYNNDGSNGWTVGADINLFRAWETTMGTNNVIVSIHDEGIDISHEDLQNNIWVNEAELNGVEGEDSDGNGYIDDIYGWNFASASGSIAAQSHGTHVGGTVAAVNNNGIGVAGVAGGDGESQGALLMPCQILGGPIIDVAPSYIYAANNGAVISQNSWGYTSEGYFDQVVLDAIDYFIAEAGDYEGSPMKGGIVIFAAGNGNHAGKWYPGYYEPCFTVASTNPNDQKADYSNYGDWIEVSAPGGETASSLSNGVLSTLPGNDYGFFQGTSMACPHVSGVAALVLSHLGGEGMTPIQLKAQLLTGVVSIEDQNPNYIGQLGSGRIDAAYTLRENEEIAPSVVEDLAMNYAGGTYINVKWSTPSDEDDGKADYFHLYYSEGEFDIETATSVTIQTKTEAGELNTFEANELQPLTAYAFAIKAFDRWGNPSELSEVIEISTNNGPLFVANDRYFNNELEDSNNYIKSDSVLIKNEGEGPLFWEADVRFSKMAWIETLGLIQTGTPVKYNQSVSILATEGIETLTLSSHTDLEEFETEFAEYINNAMVPTSTFGETELHLTNSMAVAYVAEEGGFNINSVDLALNKLTNGGAVFELYQGNNLSIADKLYSHEITEDIDAAKFHTLEFDKQYYFPEGTVFWMVLHVDNNNEYPLYIGDNNEHENSNYQWYSSDRGETWTLLSSLLGDNTQAFVIAGVSTQKHLGDFVTIKETEGTIDAASEYYLSLEANGQELVNGTYTSKLIFKSNDLENEEIEFNVRTDVSGKTADMKTIPIADFGRLNLGSEKEYYIEVGNYGYGKFVSMEPEISGNSDFELVDYPSGVLGRKIGKVRIKYTPTTEGVHNAKMTFKGISGHSEYTIFVTGVATSPSEITITPQEQTQTIVFGDAATSSVTIENTGNYPLEFTMPLYSTNVVEGQHQFGYSWELSKSDYFWLELEGQADVEDYTEDFKNNSFLDFVHVDLGFDFPFYDTLINNMYMSHVGMMAVDDKDPVNGSWGKLIGSDFTSNGYIAPLYLYTKIGVDTRFLYKRFPDKVIMEYKNLYTYASLEDGVNSAKISYQLVLYPSGNIIINYQDIDGIKDSYFPFIGVESPDKKDGFNIFEFSYQPEKIFLDDAKEISIVINNPGKRIISNLSQAEGVLDIGESVEITFDINTEGLIEDRNTQYISILSNDPFKPATNFQVNVDITDGGESDVYVSLDSLAFGDVLNGSSHRKVIFFRNKGNKYENFVSAVFEGNKLEVDKQTFTVHPRLYETLIVTFDPVELGEVTDELTVTDENGNTFVFPISANVVPAPAIGLDQTPLVFNLDAGETTTAQIVVDNVEGNADLEILPMGNNWFYETVNLQAANSLPTNTYAWKDNMANLEGVTTEQEVTFRWFDITQEGTMIDLDNQDYWKPMELPFTFDFFGEKYDTLRIGIHGVMSFNPYEGAPIGDGIWYPMEIPFAADINNLIAPIWMAGETDYYDESPIKGIWYYEDDEKFIVSYERYQHFVANLGGIVSAQTIFYKDGRIKMQYTAEDQIGVDFWNKWITIGLENKDGTEGVMPNFYRSYIRDGLAIEYTPANKVIVPIGETVTFDFTVDASTLFGGVYTSEVVFKNNTPKKEDISIPITLDVFGEGDLVWSDTVIEVGDVYHDMIMGTRLEVEFDLNNIGTAPISIPREQFGTVENATLQLYYLAEEDPDFEIPDIGGGIGPMTEDATVISWMSLNDLYQPLFLPPVIPAKESVRARLLINAHMAGPIESSAIIYGKDGTAHKITIKANAILPPRISVEGDSLNVISLTQNEKESKEFVIGNEYGNSTLNYTIDAVYERDGKPVSTTIGVFNEENTEDRVLVSPISLSNTSVQTSDSFNQTLKHYGDNSAEGGVGYGANSFSTLSKFKAPLTGFNLSHISTWYVPAGVDNATLDIEILVGEISNPKVLHTESLSTTSSREDTEGSLLTLALSEEVAIYPGEVVFLKITYPFGPARPQGYVFLEETVSDASYISTSQGWLDITTDNRYPTMTWVNAVHQMVAKDAWVTLSQFEGEVAMGEKQTITASFDASVAMEKVEKASFVISSNDPMASDKSIIATLTSNQAPTFTTIPSQIEMDEASELTIEVVAEDEEGHVISYAVADHVLVQGTTTSNDTLFINVATDYESAGEHTLDVTVTDEHGISTSAPITMTVNNVNRAPSAIAQDTLFIFLNATPTVFDPSEIFSDEDGDALTFGIAASDDGKVIASMHQGQFAVIGLEEGDTEVALIATDVHGSSTMIMLQVNISVEEEEEVPTAVDKDLLKEINLRNYPNPVIGQTTFAFNLLQTGDVSLHIYDINGVLEKTISMGRLSAGYHEYNVDLSKFSTGVHINTLSIDGNVKVYNKLIKR